MVDAAPSPAPPASAAGAPAPQSGKKSGKQQQQQQQQQPKGAAPARGGASGRGRGGGGGRGGATGVVAGTGDGVAPTGFSITIDNTSAAKVEVTKAQRGYVARGGGGSGGGALWLTARRQRFLNACTCGVAGLRLRRRLSCSCATPQSSLCEERAGVGGGASRQRRLWSCARVARVGHRVGRVLFPSTLSLPGADTHSRLRVTVAACHFTGQ